MDSENRSSVTILYNQVGEDKFERLKGFDVSALAFEPRYKIADVATVQEEYDAIAEALRTEGFRVSMFNAKDDPSRLYRLVTRERPDVILNLLEYFKDDPGLESPVAALFDLYGIPYTGASWFALALCQRKDMVKQLFSANGIPTPRHEVLHEPGKRRCTPCFPLIVKPGREDASVGVDRESVVYDEDQLAVRLDYAFRKFTPPILVEEFIDGRELHVSILGNDPPEVLPIMEYDFSELPAGQPRILSHAAKWNPLKEEYHRIGAVCPADLPVHIQDDVRDIAVRAYTATNCRDYARLDMRLSARNEIYVLEVNPNPDLTDGVSFMESARKAGLTFSQCLRRIVDMALQRKVACHGPLVSRDPEFPALN